MATHRAGFVVVHYRFENAAVPGRKDTSLTFAAPISKGDSSEAVV